VADAEINDLARRQILGAAQSALSSAGVLGIVPTPLEALATSVEIDTIIDVSDLPAELEAKKPRAWRKILGAYLLPAKTVFVDFGQQEGRARFTTAHELGHRIVPWHENAYLDDERRLFRDTEELLEKEANLAGAHLIFQGKPFFDRAMSFPVSISTPILLAGEFKASLHATIRYYIEHHPEAVAGLICGQHQRSDGTVPIFSAIESPRFRERYGAIGTRFAANELLLSDPQPLASIVLQAREAVDPPSKTVSLFDRNKERRQLTAEAFFNQRCYFIMLAPGTRLRSGRRIRVAAS
jgi:hypothetical protein